LICLRASDYLVRVITINDHNEKTKNFEFRQKRGTYILFPFSCIARNVVRVSVSTVIADPMTK
jgi:hypothetical protein